MSATRIKYNTQNIPQDFMAGDEIDVRLQEVIQTIENENRAETQINSIYDEFCETVKSEMHSKLPKNVIKLKTGLSNKRRRVKKPWWTDQLSELWNRWCEAENWWRDAHQQHKAHLKANMKIHQTAFDRAVQRAKRNYWVKQQEELLHAHSNDSKQFWKKIGKIGTGNERCKIIPFEARLEDGSINKDPKVVLEKWKKDYEGLLNPPADTNETNEMPQFSLHAEPASYNQEPQSLNAPIQRWEVMNAIRKARLGKTQVIDEIRWKS